jgi:hypothetical protein
MEQFGLTKQHEKTNKLFFCQKGYFQCMFMILMFPFELLFYLVTSANGEVVMNI